MAPNPHTFSRLLSLTALLLASQAIRCGGTKVTGDQSKSSSGVNSALGGARSTGGAAATPNGTGGFTGSTGGFIGSTGGFTGSTGGFTGSTGGFRQFGTGGCSSGLPPCVPAPQALTGVVPGENGSILRQYWLALPVGDQFTKILRESTVTKPPDGYDQLHRLQTDGFGEADTATTAYGFDFGERMLGFIRAPETGTYHFLVSGDNQVAFFLSVDDKYDSIAQKLDYCRPLEQQAPCASSPEGGPAVGAETLTPEFTATDSFAQRSQISAPVTLEAGKYYMFDWYHREARGETHAKVVWAKPGQTANFTTGPSLEIVPGSVLYMPVFPGTAGGN